MGQAEADLLHEGMTVNYWLLVPEAGLPKFELRGPVTIVALKRKEVPRAQLAPNNLGTLQAVKLSDSPCWVRREFLLSNIYEA